MGSSCSHVQLLSDSSQHTTWKDGTHIINIRCRLTHSVCRAFDVELLYIAEQLRIPIKEVAIAWHEVDGLLDLHIEYSFAYNVFFK